MAIILLKLITSHLQVVSTQDLIAMMYVVDNGF